MARSTSERANDDGPEGTPSADAQGPDDPVPVGEGYASIDYASRAYVARDPGSQPSASIDYASRRYADGGDDADAPGGYRDAPPMTASDAAGSSEDDDLANDPHYLQWRAEQMRRLDDDYRSWRRRGGATSKDR